ncbi:Hsp70 family protein [Streptomyces sp. NPDC088124]|uniref:Hsp70 family protein n=1 Tax=Streptomyces sp. NPDC088124 TaxID=3154654 RepID=UPI0034190717
MIGIDLGHRFGRIGRIGPDGGPVVTATGLDGTDGVLDPRRALPLLFGPAPDRPDGTAATGAEPDREAVLGLPASGGREDELRRAAESAGLDVLRVVPDPVAVALHYGAVSEGVDRTVLVCDQGATTLDLTTLAITPDLTVRVVRTRSHPLGGDDWDAALAAGLAGRLPDGVDARRAAEALRRALGRSDAVTETVVDQAGGRHRLTLDRAGFERAVVPLRERALAAVTEQLTTPGTVVDTVLLAGGLCATPGRRMEIEELPAAQGLTVRCHLPELAVVRGLLTLRDFGVLRIVDGAVPGPARADDRYLLPDAATATAPVPDPGPDPDPRPWHPLPEDPEPAHGDDSPADRADGRPAPPTPLRTDPVGSPRSPDRSNPPASSTPHSPPGPAPHSPPGPAADPRPSAPDTGPRSAVPTASSTSTSTSTVPGPRQAPGDSRLPPHGHEPPPDPYGSRTPGPSSPDPADPLKDPATDRATDPQALLAVPVGQLQALRRGDHLLVLWAWPDGALSSRVRWRREGGTAGPDGMPRDGDMLCRRRVYEHDGGLELAVGRGAVTLTVEALVAAPGADCEGASSLVVPAEAPVVEYEPSVRRRLKGRVASVAFISATGCDLPALRIVHSLGRFRPTSTAEGTVLYEVPAQRLPGGTPLTVEFPLPATRGPSWLVCFPADGNAATDAAVDIRPTALHRLRVT